MRILFAALGALGLFAATLPAAAGGYATPPWAELKPMIFGERPVEPAGAAVTLDTPYRSQNDARVPVEVSARLADGAAIRSVTLIIDGNPMPVSAVFEMANAPTAVRLGADMRLNGPSPVRAVIETDDGRLLMTERMVKTSGLGACSAPPMGDPDAAIAAIGDMQARPLEAGSATMSGPRRVELSLNHPQHTGMQMDQVTLHMILARYVDRIEIEADGAPLLTLTGSISLSEDPAIRFETDADTARLGVRLVDTGGTDLTRALPLLPEG